MTPAPTPTVPPVAPVPVPTPETAGYILSLRVTNAAGGIVSLEPGAPDNRYPEGTSVHLTASPNTGYQFDGWSGDAPGAARNLSVMMDADKSVRASFSKLTYALAVTPGDGGRIAIVPQDKSPDAAATVTPQATPTDTATAYPQQKSFDPGSAVSIKAAAAKGFVFKGWSGDASGNDNPLTITMDRSKSIRADFALAQFSLTVTANPVGFLDIRPRADRYNAGSVVTVIALAPDRYRFNSWSGDVPGASAGPALTLTMDADKRITANFIRTYNLLVVAEPPTGGSVSPPSGAFDEGSLVVLTATASSGYRFAGWTGNLNSGSPVANVVMDWDTVAQANFAPYNAP